MKKLYTKIDLVGEDFSFKDEISYAVKDYFEQTDIVKIFGTGKEAISSVMNWQTKMINEYIKYKNRQNFFEKFMPLNYSILLRNYGVLENYLNIIKRLELHRVNLCSESNFISCGESTLAISFDNKNAKTDFISYKKHLDYHDDIMKFIEKERRYLGTVDRLKPKTKNMKRNNG